MTKGITESGWDVMCNVDKITIDVEHRCGYLYLPEDNYPDMQSTINCFTQADPGCNCIYTFVDNKPDVAYFHTGDGWVAGYGWK